MPYHLLNIETSEYYYCDDQEWILAFNTAQADGWVPDGTLFDIVYEASDQSFDSDDPLSYFYMLVMAGNQALEWDGNYIEKMNQVIMYEDSIYFAASLEGSDVSRELIDFIKKGSFRICSE